MDRADPRPVMPAGVLPSGATGPIGPPADLPPHSVRLTQCDDGAQRYLALQQRVFFEMLGGIERQFGREHAVEIAQALAKRYPGE